MMRSGSKLPNNYRGPDYRVAGGHGRVTYATGYILCTVSGDASVSKISLGLNYSVKKIAYETVKVKMYLKIVLHPIYERDL